MRDPSCFATAWRCAWRNRALPTRRPCFSSTGGGRRSTCGATGSRRSPSADTARVALDLPGHGLSDKPSDEGRYRLASLSATVREVIAHRRTAASARRRAVDGRNDRAGPRRSGDPALGRLVLVNPACFGRVRLLPIARRASPKVVEPVLARLVPRWVGGARAPPGIRRSVAHHRTPTSISTGRRRSFPDTRRRCGDCCTSSRGRVPRCRRWCSGFVRSHRRRRRRSWCSARATASCATRVRTRPRCARRGAPLEIYSSVGGGHALNEERPREVLDARDRVPRARMTPDGNVAHGDTRHRQHSVR